MPPTMYMSSRSTSDRASSLRTTCGAAGGGRHRCSPRWRPPPMPVDAVALTPRPPLAPSDLLGGATARAAFTDHDGKSGARLEKLVIDGQPYVAKHLSLADDWIRRATGDLGCRPVLMWELGV